MASELNLVSKYPHLVLKHLTCDPELKRREFLRKQFLSEVHIRIQISRVIVCCLQIPKIFCFPLYHVRTFVEPSAMFTLILLALGLKCALDILGVRIVALSNAADDSDNETLKLVTQDIRKTEINDGAQTSKKSKIHLLSPPHHEKSLTVVQ